MRISRYIWIESYRCCGCSSDATRKKDLLGYCKDHGNDRNEIYKLDRAVIKRAKEQVSKR